MRTIVTGCALLLIGTPIAFLGLVRFGRKHDEGGAADLGIVPTDWLANPLFPDWQAQIEDSVLLAVGLVLVAVGGVIVARGRSASRQRCPR